MRPFPRGTAGYVSGSLVVSLYSRQHHTIGSYALYGIDAIPVDVVADRDRV